MKKLWYIVVVLLMLWVVMLPGTTFASELDYMYRVSESGYAYLVNEDGTALIWGYTENDKHLVFP